MNKKKQPLPEIQIAEIEITDQKLICLDKLIRRLDHALNNYDQVMWAKNTGVDLSMAYGLLDYFRSKYQPFPYHYHYDEDEALEEEEEVLQPTPDTNPVWYGGDVRGPAVSDADAFARTFESFFTNPPTVPATTNPLTSITL